MLSIILKFFKVLNSEDSPMQISLAIWFALLMSFLSVTNPAAVLVLFIVCIVRVNLTAFLLFWGLFTLIAPAYLGAVDALGYRLLTEKSLFDTWTALYNSNIGAYLQFNNTIITGGIAMALILLLPFIMLVPQLVKQYREKLLPFVAKTRLVQTLKASKIYQLYSELS